MGAEEEAAALEISGTPLDKALGMETVETLKKSGVKLSHKVGSVRHAIHAEHVGYDGIYADDVEEGGHPLNNDVRTMLLTPRIAESVRIPVVISGGAANGRSLVAALVLGDQGVMMSSRFIATRECEVHDNIKQEIVTRKEHNTVLNGEATGLQGGDLKNNITADIPAIEKRSGGLDKLILSMSGLRVREAWNTGDVELAPLMVGQSIGLINDIPICQELLDRIAKDAIDHMNKAVKSISWINSSAPWQGLLRLE